MVLLSGHIFYLMNNKSEINSLFGQIDWITKQPAGFVIWPFWLDNEFQSCQIRYPAKNGYSWGFYIHHELGHILLVILLNFV